MLVKYLNKRRKSPISSSCFSRCVQIVAWSRPLLLKSFQMVCLYFRLSLPQQKICFHVKESLRKGFGVGHSTSVVSTISDDSVLFIRDVRTIA